MFLVLMEEDSPECGHCISYFDTLQEAQKFIIKAKARFSSEDYRNYAEVTLCIILDEDEWSCESKI